MDKCHYDSCPLLQIVLETYLFVQIRSITAEILLILILCGGVLVVVVVKSKHNGKIAFAKRLFTQNNVTLSICCFMPK